MANPKDHEWHYVFQADKHLIVEDGDKIVASAPSAAFDKGANEQFEESFRHACLSHNACLSCLSHHA